MQIELGNKVGIVCNSKKLLTKIYVFIKTIFKDVNILMLHAVDDIFVTKNIRDEFGKSADNYIEKNKI